MLDYLQDHPDVFFGAWLLLLAVNLATFYLMGRKAESQFRTDPGETILTLCRATRL